MIAIWSASLLQYIANCISDGTIGMLQVTGDSDLKEDDEVSFSAGVNVATGARKATSVRLAATANGQSARRELGQVSRPPSVSLI